MASSNGKCYVTFHCQCPDTSPGDELCLLGGIPALGEWRVPYRIRLATSASAFPLWSSDAVLLPAGIEVKYKYLIMPQCTCVIRGHRAGAARRPCCCSSSSNLPRWETIPGHDDSGNRIVKLNRGSHDLFDKFGHCDFPPLSIDAPSEFVARFHDNNSNAETAASPWARCQNNAVPSPRSLVNARDFPSNMNSPAGLAEPSHNSLDATIRLNMLKAIERLCKLNATQVADLRQTMERSHSQLLQQVADPRTEEKRDELTAQVAARIADSAAARAAAAATEAITIAVREASQSVADELLQKTTQAVEETIMDRVKQLTAEAVAKSVAGASAKLDEAAEKLTGIFSRRCVSGGPSMASLGAGLHTSNSTSASTADHSHGLTEIEDSEVHLHRGSHRRTCSADVETRLNRRKTSVDAAAKTLHVPNDFASNLANNSPSTSDFTEAVLTTKDIGPDLSWIQFTLHGIKRESAAIRQMLGMICHSLDVVASQQRGGEREWESDDTTTFEISTPRMTSRHSSSSSHDHQTDFTCGVRRNRSLGRNTATKSSSPEMSTHVCTNVGAVDNSCPGSPRAVVETDSICMAKSLEKFNTKSHYFPKVYTTNGNQEWEQYISTNKGLHKGGT